MNSVCPICKNNDLKLVLERNGIPVHQHYIYNTQNEAIECTKGNLNLLLCRNCEFIFNATFDENKMSYSSNYDNNQLYSVTFQEYTYNLIDYLINDKGVINKNIVEIGCGKGDFIKELINRSKGNVGIGFDPSYNGVEEMCDGNLKFVKDFFDYRYNDIDADVVICRHVIEHIQDPLNFIINLKKSLSNSIHTKVYFETPCVEWVFKNNALWDFFYEHCSYFSIQSIKLMFELAGFKVENVKHVFGGQYLWIEASINDTKTLANTEKTLEKIVDEYIVRESNILNEWKNRLQSMKKVALWGAGAKGVTFANLIDPEGKLINCIVDINPNKQGKFIPGSGQPIIDYIELAERKITNVIVMNPNYKEEINKLISNLDLKIELLGVEK